MAVLGYAVVQGIFHDASTNCFIFYKKKQEHKEKISELSQQVSEAKRYFDDTKSRPAEMSLNSHVKYIQIHGDIKM